MLQIRLLESSGAERQHALDEHLRPGVPDQAPAAPGDRGQRTIGPPVLLIDEIDRADEEFEAFLLELLSDWQISIPEIGTIRAAQPPIVVITSNRTREVHDALKRRCLFYWIDYPTLEKEQEIVAARVPGAPSGCRTRWSLSCRSCARWTCTSCPASPKRSIGPARWWRSTRTRSRPSGRRYARRDPEVPG